MAAGPGDAGAAAAASAASRAPSSEAGIFSAISAARSPSGPAAGVGAGVGSAAATGVSTGVGAGAGAGAGASGRAMTGPVGSGGISASGTVGAGSGAGSSLGIAFLVRAVVLRLGGSSTAAGAGSSARLPRVLRRGGSPDISYPLSRTLLADLFTSGDVSGSCGIAPLSACQGRAQRACEES